MRLKSSTHINASMHNNTQQLPTVTSIVLVSIKQRYKNNGVLLGLYYCSGVSDFAILRGQNMNIVLLFVFTKMKKIINEIYLY